MSKIGKSVQYLAKGNFLHSKTPKSKDTANSGILTLSKSGLIMRENLIKNFIVDVQRPLNVSTNMELSKEAHAKVKSSLASIIVKNNSLMNKNINWKSTNSPFTMLNIPKNISSDKLQVRITPQKFEKSLDDNTNTKEATTKYDIDISSDVAGCHVHPCVLYTLLPLQRDEGKWTFAYQDLLRSRRKWWRKYFFNPSAVEITETDSRSDVPKASIAANFEDQNFDLSNNLTLETMRMLDKDEVPQLVLNSAKDDKETKSLSDTFKVVEICCHISQGCTALLLDGVRKRLFLESTRLALDKNLAPFKVALCCVETLATEKEKLEMNMLKRYLQQLLDKSNITAFDNSVSTVEAGNQKKFFNDYEAADAYGVPHLIVITSDSLKDGVINIRDREVSNPTQFCL